jgi:TPR repeat protein
MFSTIFTPRYLLFIIAILAISSFATYTLSTNTVATDGIEIDKQIDKALSHSLNGNHTDAIKLLFPLAHRGIPRAKLYLGVAYFHGNGVPKDHKRSQDLFFELQKLEYEPHIVSTYLNLLGSMPDKG